ncbi:hypothetical protein SS1G_09483 [Sclerotinia sclerotiorum 1980 UF-70]|uniref:Uncharacterized protein n=1 Tax=Sclerotinia sclerotiorum (strain ATCC 18683 / 1980 / Ss-1) TaxID=665079 RepID=A7EVX4_SCLS1|nr:hypothetical protein SS1G_09483 [Sclerotinia sclerotiorum 1980 UF-70]EDN93616.1 hypothetical protein SS1G_09483 [Sclerotinia sclerotiorum 1980 UF-70]
MASFIKTSNADSLEGTGVPEILQFAAEAFRFAVPSFVGSINWGRSCVGESPEKEGKEVNDLSEIDDAELDICEASLRDFPRTVCDR